MTQNIQRGTIYLEELTIGMVRELTKIITDKDIHSFAEISTDYNPVHMDDDYAQDTLFNGRIAHGMLTASLISAIIGEQLPGHGTIYMKQDLKFLAPVRPDDEVRAQVVVKEINMYNARVVLECTCFVGDVQVLTGDAMVLAPKRN